MVVTQKLVSYDALFISVFTHWLRNTSWDLLLTSTLYHGRDCWQNFLGLCWVLTLTSDYDYQREAKSVTWEAGNIWLTAADTWSFLLPRNYESCTSDAGSISPPLCPYVRPKNIITSVYCIFIVSLRVLSVGVALALCVGVPLLGVDLADPPVVEGTLTTPALLLPP